MIIQVSLQLLFHYCIINDQIGLSQLRWNLNIRQQSTTADQSTQTWLLWHLSPCYDGCSISAGTWNTKYMSILLGASGTFYISFLVHGTISLCEPCHPDNLSCPVLCEPFWRLVLSRLFLPEKAFVLGMLILWFPECPSGFHGLNWSRK